MRLEMIQHSYLPVQESEPFGLCRTSAHPSVLPRRCSATVTHEGQSKKRQDEDAVRASVALKRLSKRRFRHSHFNTHINATTKVRGWIQQLRFLSVFKCTSFFPFSCIVTAALLTVKAHLFSAQLYSYRSPIKHRQTGSDDAQQDGDGNFLVSGRLDAILPDYLV